MTISAETGIPDKQILFLRYVRYVLTLALGLFFACETTSADEQRAAKRNGESIGGKLCGGAPDALKFVSSQTGAHEPLGAFAQISSPARVRLLATTTPQRKIVAWGGETLTGELRLLSDDKASLVFPQEAAIETPADGLAAILNPSAHTTILYEDFERPPAISKSAQDGPQLDRSHFRSGQSSLRLDAKQSPLVYALAEPLSRCEASLSFDGGTKLDPRRQWFVEFVFATNSEKRIVRVILGFDQANYAIESSDRIPLAVQRLARTAGWHRLTMALRDERLLFFIDQDVLATGDVAIGALREVRIGQRAVPAAKAAAKRAQSSGEWDAWIDDLRIETRVTPVRSVRTEPQRDMLVLSNGDDIFGHCDRCDTQEVTLTGAFGTRRFPWTGARGLYLQRHPVSCRSISGWIAKVVLQPGFDAAGEDPDWLIGAIQSVDDNALALEHPLFGKLRLAIPDIQRIEPFFFGESRCIELAEQHLGDEMREDFRWPLPDGPKFVRDFRLDAVPPGDASLSLFVDNLEPAGRETAPKSPFLEELKAGDLLTEVYVNDQRIGDLNRMISVRAPTGRPERVSVTIPAKVLHTGENQVRIEQRPSRRDPYDFDDCCISHVTLEWTAPAR